MSTPRRVVVVDDDPKVRLLLERAFRAPEFEIHTFATGAAALGRVEAIRPDCVVSDILMPDMDGETFLRALRGIAGFRRVPFVAVSAVRSEARIKAVLAAGADAFLLKPFPLRDLLGKVRSLLERPAAPRPGPERTSEPTSPTQPVYTVPHTTSTTAIRRRGGSAPAEAPAAAPAGPVVVRVVAPARIVVPAAPSPASAAGGVRQIELRPRDRLGFGRYTRVEIGGRSLVVLTEATAQPKFTVTTVITEKEMPLRKIETALPHPLAREDDQDTVRRQLDLQHDDVLRRLDHLILDQTPRRVVWSDQNRSVDGGLLAWTMSAVAQLAEAESGTDEATRLLRLTLERVQIDEQGLRAFHVTPTGRVVTDPDHAGRMPRRAVRAVAAWCSAFASAALQASGENGLGPVRQATRRHAAELERLGFYERLQRRVRA